jgi:hypothetical protein
MSEHSIGDRTGRSGQRRSASSFRPRKSYIGDFAISESVPVKSPISRLRTKKTALSLNKSRFNIWENLTAAVSAFRDRNGSSCCISEIDQAILFRESDESAISQI